MKRQSMGPNSRLRSDSVRLVTRSAAWSLGSAAVALITAGASWAQDAGSAHLPEPPSISSLRYNEDYSYLRNPAERSGAWWAAYKFVPLDASGSVYLTLGNESRVRFESYRNNEFGSGPKPSESYGLLRDMPYADLHIGPNVRAFGQLVAAYAARSSLTKGPVDETRVDLLQGFMDLRLPLGTVDTLTLRGGRQVMAYGSERLISARYGPNVLRSFDSGLARWQFSDWRVDAFWACPVENNLRSFDDHPDRTQTVWSLYATWDLPPLGRDSGLDLFYVGYSNEVAAFNQGEGRELRHTLGSRLFGTSRSWKWDVEGHLQFGRFAGGDIRAWSIATDVRYTFVDLPLTPYIEMRANLISGDSTPKDGTLGTFNALFPKGKYFGEIGLIGPANLINLHPIVGIDLGSGWSLSAAAVFYWRANLGDGIYGAPGNLLRPSAGSRERYIGTQADLVLAWEPTRTLSFEVAYSTFKPGPFIEETGPQRRVHFFGAETMFRF